MTPNATPMPMPAFAPALRPELPEEFGTELGVLVTLPDADDVAEVVETVDVDVAEDCGRPTVV